MAGEWEYRDYERDMAYLGVTEHLKWYGSGVERSQAREEYWLAIKQDLLEDLRHWFDEGWEPITPIGVDCLRISEQRRHEPGGNNALFGANTYFYPGKVIISMRRKRGIYQPFIDNGPSPEEFAAEQQQKAQQNLPKPGERTGLIAFLSILNFLQGGFCLLCILIILRSISPILAEPGLTGEEQNFRLSFLTGMIAVFTALSGMYLAIGYGLWKVKNWARIGAMVLAGIALLVFPVGTVIGFLVIFFLNTPATNSAFSQKAKESDVNQASVDQATVGSV
jgi:hypothetical protein